MAKNKPTQTSDRELSILLKIDQQLMRTWGANERRRILLYLLQKYGHYSSVNNEGIWVNLKPNK